MPGHVSAGAAPVVRAGRPTYLDSPHRLSANHHPWARQLAKAFAQVGITPLAVIVP
ncbi:hypothetical protein [Carbonactinospora thermoautotrophica]|uniref:hypothetical protein n=1 Tax=Carbonactinospora thermoautotrophica TaxID=1469144 RepID=UPI00226F790B|nr:hypothetical protein [Carbonactinospora thermoautotrophica]